MDRHQILKQTNAFSMADGLFFGIYCSIGFLCMIKGVANNTLAMLGLVVTLTVPVMGCYFARKFERQVRDDAPVSFGRAYLCSVLLYIYASVLLAACVFIYFQWFDKGAFVDSYVMAFNSPETQAALKQSGMDASFDEAMRQSGFRSVREMLSSISAFDMSSTMLNMNVMAGLLLALPTALFGKTRQRDVRQ